jgi:hypothetical protein
MIVWQLGLLHLIRRHLDDSVAVGFVAPDQKAAAFAAAAEVRRSLDAGAGSSAAAAAAAAGLKLSSGVGVQEEEGLEGLAAALMSTAVEQGAAVAEYTGQQQH